MTSITTEVSGLAATPSSHVGVLAQLWRRRVTFTSVFVFIVTLVGIALLVLPKRYLASGTVMVAGPEPLPGSASVPASMTWQQKLGDPADLESNLILIVSPRLLRRVISTKSASDAIRTECNSMRGEFPMPLLFSLMTPSHSCSAIAANDDLKLEWVSGRYGTGSLGRSRLISIGYTSPLPEVARQMADLLIDTYLDDERAARVKPREAGVAWLGQETARLSKALQQDETAVEAFRTSHGLLQGQYASITSERLTQTAKLLAEAQLTRAEAAAQLIALGKGDGADSATILTSRTIIDLKQQSATIGVQLASLSQKYGTNHPILAPLQRERDEVQARLALETARIRGSIEHNYQAASAQVADLSKELAKIKEEAGEASDYETQIAGMVRETEITRTLYVELSQRMSQLQTEREVLTASTQLVNLAEKPMIASFPKPVPFLVGGLMLGGILATATALHRDKTDRRLRVPDVLQARTSLSVLARIPVADRGRTMMIQFGERSLTLTRVLEQLRSPSMLQEAVRRLYARLALAGFGGGSGRTLLVTSSDAREGKTMVTLSIAQFAAANGRNVLLVECDLRKPSLQAALDMPNPAAAGLTEYLAGKVTQVPVVHVAGQPGLDVILAGEASITSTELLVGQRFDSLLKLAQSYDLVLLDSPPCELLMDACVIAPRVDGVLFCARWGKAEPERVASSLISLEAAGGTIAGLVLTFTPQAGQYPYGANVVYCQNRLAPTGDQA